MAEGSRDGLRLDVLGPLVLRRGATDVTPSSAIARRLLCLLACRSPATVSVGELIEVAWPDGSVPKEPEQNLHTHIARIRRLGGARPGEPGLVATSPNGYGLAPGALQLDLDDLDELTSGGLTADDEPSTLRRLSQAVSLWRGRSLHDIADTDPGRGDAVRLDELRLSITEARFECMLATGVRADLVHDVEAFTIEHPYRERPYAVLMRVLNDLGRHADALAAFQRLRTRLADDLGLEPSPALRALEADILDHRLPEPAAMSSTHRPAGPDARPPARLTPLLGREELLGRVDSALDRSRLVTVVGAGGVGKTRLALELAHRRSGGDPGAQKVLWCDISAAEDETGVIDRLGASVQARRHPDEPLRAAAIRAVTEADPILVLDNCEQVVEAAADVVVELLRGSEHVRVLATSRTPFDVPGESVVRVEPLRYDVPGEVPDVAAAQPPAVELFVERCAAAGVDVRSADPDLALATRICRAVDGLPLGIELAAAQLRNVPLAQVVTLLERDLGPLEVGRRRGPAWQRSIGATLDWSYRLLTPGDQELLAAVSTFSGSFGADAAAALVGSEDPGAIDDRLQVLADLSLLTVEPDPREVRYGMLGTTRRFGRKVLADTGREAGLTARHRDWVRALVDEQSVALRELDEADAARLLGLATDDIRSVLTRATAEGDVDTALSICGSLADFAFHRLRDDLFEWTDRAQSLPSAPEHPGYGPAMASLARGLTSRGDLRRAETVARDALSSAPEDARTVLVAHHALALTSLYSGRLDDAASAARASLEVAEAAGEDIAAETACVVNALAALYGGDPDGALEWAERSGVFAEQSGQPSATAWAQYAIGEVVSQRDPDRAERSLLRAIELGESVGNVFVVDVAAVSLAAMRSASSEPRAALRTFGRLIRRWDARNDWTHQWTTLQNVAPLVARSGHPEDAAVLVGALTASAERPLFSDAAAHIGQLERALVAQLGDEQFHELRGLGASLPRRELIGLAVRLTEGAI